MSAPAPAPARSAAQPACEAAAAAGDAASATAGAAGSDSEGSWECVEHDPCEWRSAGAAPAACSSPTARLSAAEMELVLADELRSQQEAGDVVSHDSLDLAWVREAAAHCDRYLAGLDEADETCGLSASAESSPDSAPRTRGPAGSDSGAECAPEPTEGADAEWAPRAVLRRRAWEGEAYWLVSWGPDADPTWETEEWLIEEGHGTLIDRFRRARAAPPRAPRPRRLPPVFDPAHYWPDFMQRIDALFLSVRHSALRVENICDHQRARAFMDRFVQLREEEGLVVPAMLCHGTHPSKVSAIAKHGLRIPAAAAGRGGVRIANGSAHGVGIYTSRCPLLSMTYACGSGQMLVCAGLITRKHATTTKQVGNIVVFFDESLVLPCFLVTHRPGTCIRATGVSAVEPVYYDRLVTTYQPWQQDPVYRPIAACSGAPSGKTIRTGDTSGRKHVAYDREQKALSKRQMRGMPRQVKEAYRAGLLTQRKGGK